MQLTTVIYLDNIEELAFVHDESLKWLSKINLGDYAILSIPKDPMSLRNLEILRNCIDEAIEFQKKK